VASRQASKAAPHTFSDYREMLRPRNLDVVLVATPDHWHALPAIAAMEAGADVYLEKPVGMDVVEGQALVSAARRHNRVVQVNLQRRSTAHLIDARDNILRAGKPRRFIWAFGDGTTLKGQRVKHTFARPGVYTVSLTASDGKYEDECLAIVRAHPGDAAFASDRARHRRQERAGRPALPGLRAVERVGPSRGEQHPQRQRPGDDQLRRDPERLPAGARKRPAAEPLPLRLPRCRCTIDGPESGQWGNTEPIVTPAGNKPLFDPACLSVIIGERLGQRAATDGRKAPLQPPSA
jgi:hypothetical protein